MTPLEKEVLKEAFVKDIDLDKATRLVISRWSDRLRTPGITDAYKAVFGEDAKATEGRR